MRVCMCVCVLCEFFISVARRLNLIPRGFFNSARTWTHNPEHRCTREEDGSNNIMVGKRHILGSWKQTSFSRRMTWMDAHRWDSRVNKHQQTPENMLKTKKRTHVLHQFVILQRDRTNWESPIKHVQTLNRSNIWFYSGWHKGKKKLSKKDHSELPQRHRMSH